MNSPILQVRQLVRHFGPVRAVDDISFELFPGQSVGLIGANGAGKTTAMRMLTTLDVPDSGEIIIDGIDALKSPEKVRTLIGWMPDAISLPPMTTVRDYIDFFARAYGLVGDHRVSEVSRVLEFCHISDLQNRKVTKLSKGQEQRLSLARTLIGNPRLLILDEPAAGLDPKARVEFKQLVQTLLKEGKTLLISSHILSELSEMCDTMIFMNDGKIIRQGNREELARGEQEGTCIRLAVVGDNAGLTLHLQESDRWKVQQVTPQSVTALFLSDDPQKLADELRELCAAFPICEFAHCTRALEDTFIDILNHAANDRTAPSAS